MSKNDVIIKENFIRVHFQGVDNKGFYPVTELPEKELEYEDPMDAASYLMAATHGTRWLAKGRRPMRFGDRFSIGSAQFELCKCTDQAAMPLSGIWSSCGIREAQVMHAG